MILGKDHKKKTAEIDVSEDKIYIVKNGEIEVEDPPRTGFGETLCSWQDGKVNAIKTAATRRI